MNWISILEKRFGSWAIPNLTVYLLVIQAIGIVLLLGGYVDDRDLLLHGGMMMERGQWWRLLSFMMLPSVNLNSRMFMLWLFFSFYIFYLMGSALEREWGTFRYNLYILCGYLLTVLMSLLSPGSTISNTFFLGSVFLAFATLFPNFQFMMFFLIPMKVKWIGWLTAGMYVYVLLVADSGSRLCVLAAFITYGLFFGQEFIRNLKAGKRRKDFVAERAVAAGQPLHVCTECGATDKSNPDLMFRYCSTCRECFCETHIGNHGHEG